LTVCEELWHNHCSVTYNYVTNYVIYTR
jgi:hypothetical protein